MTTKYTVQFKSGARLHLDIIDGVAFVAEIVEGMRANPSVPKQFYCNPGILICVSDVDFVAPTNLTKEP